MELPIERSDLGLIEEDRDYIFHESVLVEYTERPSMRQPRDSLGEFRNTVGKLEHCIELNWEFSLKPSWRGGSGDSLIAAGRSFF